MDLAPLIRNKFNSLSRRRIPCPVLSHWSIVVVLQHSPPAWADHRLFFLYFQSLWLCRVGTVAPEASFSFFLMAVLAIRLFLSRKCANSAAAVSRPFSRGFIAMFVHLRLDLCKGAVGSE